MTVKRSRHGFKHDKIGMIAEQATQVLVFVCLYAVRAFLALLCHPWSVAWA